MFKKFKTLQEITASFDKAIEDLKNLEERDVAAVRHNDARISSLQQHNVELTTELGRAVRFRTNLQELIGS